MGLIYMAKNKINNKVYIGQTINSLQRRRSAHIRTANNDSHYTFHKALRAYGIDNFEWIVLEQVDDNTKLDEREKYYIQYYHANDLEYGYNMTAGGNFSTETNRLYWDDEEYGEARRQQRSKQMTEFWSCQENREAHRQWMQNFYASEQGQQQAKRHSQFMQEYYNGPDARKNKAKTARFFVKATSPEGQEQIFISSKEPNLLFGTDIQLRRWLKEVGDIWIPTPRARKVIQGWRFEAIPKFEL